MGWEEICSASTAHLLRTSLSKKQQSQPQNMVVTNMDPLESTDRLKKQIAAVLDRVRTGGVIEL